MEKFETRLTDEDLLAILDAHEAEENLIEDMSDEEFYLYREKVYGIPNPMSI